MSDETTALGEVVGSGARRAREAENCDASVRRSGGAEPMAWPYGTPSASPALRTARLPRGTVVLSIARTRKKDEIMAWLQPCVEQRLAESDVILEAIDART